MEGDWETARLKKVDLKTQKIELVDWETEIFDD